MEDGGPDPAPSPRRANPSQFITLPLPVRVLGAPALAGVASSNQVLRSLPSAGHSTSPPPAAGARKKERKERKKRKARGGKKKKKDGHWPAWSLQSQDSSLRGPKTSAVGQTRLPEPRVFFRKRRGRGWGRVLRTKSLGARWIFFFFLPSPLLTKEKNKIK